MTHLHKKLSFNTMRWLMLSFVFAVSACGHPLDSELHTSATRSENEATSKQTQLTNSKRCWDASQRTWSACPKEASQQK